MGLSQSAFEEAIMTLAPPVIAGSTAFTGGVLWLAGMTQVNIYSIIVGLLLFMITGGLPFLLVSLRLNAGAAMLWIMGILSFLNRIRIGSPPPRDKAKPKPLHS